MSEKNFVSYGSAETVLTEFANNIKNNVITETVSSSSISITDSADARVQDIKIYGTEDGVGASGLMVTAVGKNLIEIKDGYPLQESGNNEYTITKNSDGTFEITGTNTSSGYAYFKLVSHNNLPKFIPGKRYILSGRPVEGIEGNVGLFFASNSAAFNYADKSL